MELGGGGGFWELSSAFSPAPPLLSFNQHDAMMLDGSGLQGMPLMDPHLTCLKLGKRHYFEDGGERAQDQFLGGKKRKGFSGPSVAGPVPRCQVEGCNMVLIHAKDYHRRHKVCEMHSKAPKVVVLGLEQRFCQQCSRFHVISEFDDSKRSCRRRLAGHNERRRKSSNDSMGKINPCQDHSAATGRHQCMPSSPEGAGGALSLLSSAASYTSDLSRRSSAALRELIAENRAASLARQFISDHPSCPHPFFSTSHGHHQPRWSSHFHEHVTLDLMQTPASSSYGPLVHGGGRRKEDDECCDIWKSLEGAHVDIC